MTNIIALAIMNSACTQTPSVITLSQLDAAYLTPEEACQELRELCLGENEGDDGVTFSGEHKYGEWIVIVEAVAVELCTDDSAEYAAYQAQLADEMAASAAALDAVTGGAK